MNKTGPGATNTLYVANRQAWRGWLMKHYQSENEIWLVYYTKRSGKPRLAYNDAVEEALCFGWIDSTVKKLDSDRFAQRFSRRRPGSPYSQANKERLKEQIRQGKVVNEVLAAVGDLPLEFEIPADILAAIEASPKAKANLEKFSPAYIRIRVAFIAGARNRPREFAKRLKHFIVMTEKNKQFGFGGISKYY